MNPVDELLTERAAESTTWMERSECRAEVERMVVSGWDRTVATAHIWNVFHPRRGEDVRPAKVLCSTCPVSEDCLEYALTTFLKHGVWGGRSERERRRIRKDRRQAATAGENLPTLTPIMETPPHRCSKRKGICNCDTDSALKDAHRSHPGNEAAA